MLVKYNGQNTNFKTYLGEIFCDFTEQNPIEIDDETAIQYLDHPFFEVYENKPLNPIVAKLNELSFDEIKAELEKKEYAELNIKVDKRIKDKETLIESIVKQL